MHLRIVACLLTVPLLAGASLPKTGPLPEKKPTVAETSKPAEEKSEKDAPKTDRDEKPLPIPDHAKPLTEKPETEPEPVLTIETEDSTEYDACLAALKQIGATFKEEKRIDDGKGCGIDKPLTLDMVLPGVALKPEGKMRCETALELARWTKEAVIPAANAALPSEGPLVTINQASSYVCRLRNNGTTGKISEHARGNAIDIASFTFKSGKSIEIRPRDEDSTLAGAFQRAVTATGCLYFKTVLDPGSDAAHETHLHFDVLERKNGYRYCR